jgi:DNA-binding MarR family transcriptional regulator
MSGEARLDPERHAAFQIVALANRISSSASRAYLRCFGIGVMEWRVLALLAAKPGITAAEVSQLSGVDKSPVSRAVQALARHGRLRPEEDALDSRRIRLFLTSSGQVLHDRVIRASLAREARLLAGFSAGERTALFEFLKRLAANLPLVETHDPANEDR